MGRKSTIFMVCRFCFSAFNYSLFPPECQYFNERVTYILQKLYTYNFFLIKQPGMERPKTIGQGSGGKDRDGKDALS